ncbi:unnamed protein product, partial [Ilex paraguariensis]
MLANPSLHGGPLQFTSSNRHISFHSSVTCPLYLRSKKPGFPPPLSLLLSRRRRRRRLECIPFRIRASAEFKASQLVGESAPYVPQPISVKIPVGDRHILVETGHIGRQASGAVTVTDGET